MISKYFYKSLDRCKSLNYYLIPIYLANMVSKKARWFMENDLDYCRHNQVML